MTIYPNPTSGILHIKAEDLRSISVSNALGQQVYNSPADGNEIEFNLGNHESGVFLIRIETASGTATKRVVLTK